MSRGAAGVALVLVTCTVAACGGDDGGRATSTSGSATTDVAPTVRAVDAPWSLPAPVAREVVVPSRDSFTIVGGLDATSSSTGAIVRVAVATGKSQLAGTLAEAVHDAAGVRQGGRILVFGGTQAATGTADVQSAARDGSSSVVGRLPGPRADHVAARVGGATYVFGGDDGTAIVPDILRTTDGAAFTRIGALPVPVRYPALAVVGSAIYLFGGVSDPARGIDTVAVQRFDTSSGVIDIVARLPASVSHASAVVLGGEVYLLGGYVDNTRLSDQILRFDPATGAAIATGTLPAPVSDAAAVVVDGRGYLVGGEGADRVPRAAVTIVTVG